GSQPRGGMLTMPLPVAGFGGPSVGVRRPPGLGFVVVFATGYFNGIIRANFLGVFTTFMFDAALLGLYLGTAIGHPALAREMWAGRAGRFCLFLIGWPAVLSLVPVNDLLVQFVALRATVFFLPVMLIATRMSSADLGLMARGLAVLNLCALVGGVYVYQNGVAALYPENAVTQIIYNSKDVGGFEYHRVPSTFLSAHAYGGGLLPSLPPVLAPPFRAGGGRPPPGLAAPGAPGGPPPGPHLRPPQPAPR